MHLCCLARRLTSTDTITQQKRTQYKDKTSNKPLNAENKATCYLVLQWAMSQANMLTHDDLIRAARVVTHPSLFT